MCPSKCRRIDQITSGIILPFWCVMAPMLLIFNRFGKNVAFTSKTSVVSYTAQPSITFNISMADTQHSQPVV